MLVVVDLPLYEASTNLSTRPSNLLGEVETAATIPIALDRPRTPIATVELVDVISLYVLSKRLDSDLSSLVNNLSRQ